ncbi:hypothetical protein [Adlercreutzia faecimuris]|uniref:Uncharacterized protein n=1 Tax=Adlercreutzia faecimuris TaxID=2897341 RepID=A0ABS9WGH7_9ACTN|nr:hypothetical protein [Adlercreutzia sp. JBNU-10]MCI2241956.1 hypothetical protein [Adlercreutzia sp. JBNU-10]
MRNCEKIYPVIGSSALKPASCPRAHGARIIGFPATRTADIRPVEAQGPTTLTRAQSAVLFAAGCAIALGSLLMTL